MSNPEPTNSHDSPSWFEKPSNINLVIWVLAGACALTLVAQLVFEMFDKKHPPHFPGIEDFFGFQAAFGFLAFVTVVFLGKFLRTIIRRKEDYYDS